MRACLLCLVLLCCIQKCYAGNTGILFGVGAGANQTKIYRASLVHMWCKPLVTANERKLNGYWDLSFERINATGIYQPPNTPNVQVTSGSAVLRFKPALLRFVYLDFGVGLAYFSKQSIAMRRLGSNLLFEDRVGVGILLGKSKQLEIGYRVMHYSNAYLASVNNGLNLQMLVLGYWF